jgi:hypothetical protein
VILPTLSNDELLSIYRQLAEDVESRESRTVKDAVFLQGFATALLYAKPENFKLLRGTAIILVEKYKLGRYLGEKKAG